MDKETRDYIDRLQLMVDANVKQANEAKSHFVQGWYFGRVAGLQLAQIMLLNDEDFTMDSMIRQDRTFQSVQNIEELYKDKE